MLKVQGNGNAFALIGLLLAFLLFPIKSWGAPTCVGNTCWAEGAENTGAHPYVQEAINACKGLCNTVIIPPGTGSWTTSVVWTAPPNATLRGSGSFTTTGGGDVTVIIDDSSSWTLLGVTTNASGSFRLAGITIRGGAGATKENALISIAGGSKQVRIDHNHIDRTTYSTRNSGKMISLGGAIAGVVDHNIFDSGPNPGGWLHIVNGGSTGDGVWAAPTGFGGSDFIFIEDNQYRGGLNTELSPPCYIGNLTDCHTGGRYVARYNTLVAAAVGQTHPTGHAGHDRGCRAHEIYGNTVTSPINKQTEQPNFSFEYNNSGPALIWGNSFDGVFKNIIYLNVIRKDNKTYAQTETPNGWGYCGTEFNGTGSNWDGNANTTSGYPCLDQPGRGQGDLLSGDFPNQVNTRTSSISWPNQALEPIYEWLNVGNVIPGWGGSYVNNLTPSRIAENRDYYLYTERFNGTSGVGSGPRANRPATCTKGVAYWSTDQGGNWNTSNSSANDGTLDVCTATNTWTNTVYTPYPYPHPLTKEQNAFAPPANLRIVK